MNLKFFKLSGAGNDFVLLSGGGFNTASLKKLAVRLCPHKTAVGADGLLYVNKAGSDAVSMRYFNSDGSETFCGNGSRCSAWWAYASGLVKTKKFLLKTISGDLPVEIVSRETVKMRMPDVSAVSLYHKGVWPRPLKAVHFLNTGVPHAVIPVKNPDNIDVAVLGRLMRYHKAFGKAGTNVDFIRLENGIVKIRTYERGVEAETLACGTGITASAIALGLSEGLRSPVTIISKTGEKFRVWYKRSGSGASDIQIQGPAKIVFEGTIEV